MTDLSSNDQVQKKKPHTHTPSCHILFSHTEFLQRFSQVSAHLHELIFSPSILLLFETKYATVETDVYSFMFFFLSFSFFRLSIACRCFHSPMSFLYYKQNERRTRMKTQTKTASANVKSMIQVWN